MASLSPPAMSLTAAESLRYDRQIRLPQIGVAGQARISAGRVLVIGAGGLGSPAALYLAAAGVGTLGIADFDRVEPHNLHRQLLHADATLGQAKTTSAAQRLRTTNPLINVVEHPEGISVTNALALFANYDVIVDGSDNFPTRYLSNDAAVLTRRPLVHGSLFGFAGQVTVFDSARGGPCYRCLFPEPPSAGSVPNCGEAGVLGALCGVIGSLQAVEALKLLTGIGTPLVGKLLTYDALAGEQRTLAFPRDPACPACGDAPTIHTLDAARYDFTCAPEPASQGAAMDNSETPLELSVEDTKARLDAHPADTALIDVRESFEWDLCKIPGAEHIPMRQIPERVGSLPRDKHLLIHCHHGGRSLRVTQYLRAQGFTRVSNVAGGIDAWSLRIDPSTPRY